MLIVCYFFFFKQKTAYEMRISDWSSDVCSSDLLIQLGEWDEERQAAMDLDLAERVRAAQKEAEKNGILGHGLHQPLDTLFEGVYEEMPWHLREQQDRKSVV